MIQVILYLQASEMRKKCTFSTQHHTLNFSPLLFFYISIEKFIITKNIGKKIVYLFRQISTTELIQEHTVWGERSWMWFKKSDYLPGETVESYDRVPDLHYNICSVDTLSQFPLFWMLVDIWSCLLVLLPNFFLFTDTAGRVFQVPHFLLRAAEFFFVQ